MQEANANRERNQHSNVFATPRRFGFATKRNKKYNKAKSETKIGYRLLPATKWLRQINSIHRQMQTRGDIINSLVNIIDSNTNKVVLSGQLGQVIFNRHQKDYYITLFFPDGTKIDLGFKNNKPTHRKFLNVFFKVTCCNGKDC